MVAVHIMTTVAQQETAKQAILKRLREADATSPAMPASIEIDNEEAQAALAELLAAGTVREARNGLYYAEESKAGTAGNGFGFAALLAVLVIISVTASVIALTAGR
jgi:competence protein ComGC